MLTSCVPSFPAREVWVLKGKALPELELLATRTQRATLHLLWQHLRTSAILQQSAVHAFIGLPGPNRLGHLTARLDMLPADAW